MFVKEIATQHITQIHVNAALQEAADLVAFSGISELMVVDPNGRFVGVLSEEAILEAMMPDTNEVFAIGGSVDDAYAVFLQKGATAANRPILPLIVREPVMLKPDSHIAEAAIILADRSHRYLPVVDNGKLVGIVSRAAVCRAAMHSQVLVH
jgi:CBS domain-containing protein